MYALAGTGGCDDRKALGRRRRAVVQERPGRAAVAGLPQTLRLRAGDRRRRAADRRHAADTARRRDVDDGRVGWLTAIEPQSARQVRCAKRTGPRGTAVGRLDTPTPAAESPVPFASPVPIQRVWPDASLGSSTMDPTALMPMLPERYSHRGLPERALSVRHTPPPAAAIQMRQSPGRHVGAIAMAVMRPDASVLTRNVAEAIERLLVNGAGRSEELPPGGSAGSRAPGLEFLERASRVREALERDVIVRIRARSELLVAISTTAEFPAQSRQRLTKSPEAFVDARRPPAGAVADGCDIRGHAGHGERDSCQDNSDSRQACGDRGERATRTRHEPPFSGRAPV